MSRSSTASRGARWDREHGLDSLVPIASTRRRLDEWSRATGRAIRFEQVDVTDYAAFSRVVCEIRPEAIVHFGQQRSAPFSMIDREHAVRTHLNNTVGNMNVLWALREHAPQRAPHQARHDGRVRHAEHRRRGRLHHGRAQRAQRPAAVSQAARLRSTISPRSATAIRSTSRAAFGDCARPISTKESCTERTPSRPRFRRRWRTASTTTTSSAPC